MNNKFNILIFFLVLIVVIAVILIVLAYTTNIFKNKQQDKKNSLQQGYGYYSDPFKTQCINKNSNSTKCNEPSTYKIISQCIPNPVTNKGCIDENGNMTYQTRVQELPCNITCTKNYIRESDSLNLSQIGENLYQVNGSGCNKIINKYTGIDYSDYFLGEYNLQKNNYSVEKCIPESDFIGYSQKVLNCVPGEDTFGKNNCTVTCGNIQTLRLNGVFGNKLSKNVLQYFPFEYNEDGTRRNVCYDLNGVNQVEILNSTENVPANFVFPDKCYSLYNDKNNIDFNYYSPIGTSNIAIETSYYSSQTDFFIVSLDKNNLENIGIENNYNFYNNVNNFVKTKINNEPSLLENIIYDFDNYININNNLNNNFGNFYYKGTPPSSYGISGGGTVTINSGISTFIGGEVYTLLNTKDNEIFRSNEPKKVAYFYNGTSSIIHFPSGIPPYIDSSSYIYMLEQNTNSTLSGKLSPVVGINTSENIAYFSEKIINSDFSELNIWELYTPSDETFGVSLLNSTGGVYLNENVNYTNIDESEIVVYRTNNIGTSAYYYYGNLLNQRAYFYYPLYGTSTSVNNIPLNFVNLKITLWGDSNKGKNYGPSSGDKDVNGDKIYLLEETIGTAKIKLNYPENSIIPYGFNTIQTGINYGSSLNFTTSTDFGVSLFSVENENKVYAEVIRSNSSKITLPVNEKITDTYSIFRNSILLENLNFLNENNYSFIIEPKRNFILSANYEIFQSPYKINNGKIEKVCIGDDGKELKNGTVINLESGDKVYYNSPCSDFNVEDISELTCGELLTNNNKCMQSTNDNTGDFSINCEGISKNNSYYNNDGFMEEGLVLNRELKCSGKNCFPPFYTEEVDENKKYLQGEEVYENKKRNDYFLSLVNNNTQDPLNSLFWSRVFEYQPNTDVKEGEKFFIKDENSLYIYECTKSGIAPFDIKDISINYQYEKSESIFTTFKNYGISVGDVNSINPKIFTNIYRTGTENYFDNYINATLYPVVSKYSRFVNEPLIVNYGISSNYENYMTINVSVSNSVSRTGDTYIPSFAIWNKFIAQYLLYNSEGGQGFNFFAGVMENSIKNGSQIESITQIEQQKITLKKGDFLIGFPCVNSSEFLTSDIVPILQTVRKLTLGWNKGEQESVFSDCSLISPISNQIPPEYPQNIIKENINLLGEFEVMLVEETNVNNIGTSFRIKRNALDTPTVNLLNNSTYIKKGNDAYFNQILLLYLPEGCVDLNYNVTGVDDNGYLNFSVTSKLNSTLGISQSIIENKNVYDATDTPYQRYFVSKSADKEITYPVQNYNNNNYIIYNNIEMFNIMTDILPENNYYYMNEYKIDNEKNVFNLSDIIGIDLTDKIYEFSVIEQNIRYQNKNFDYKCVLQNGTSSEFNNAFENNELFSYYSKAPTNMYYVPVTVGVSTVYPNLAYFGFIKENNYDGTYVIGKQDGTSSVVPGNNYELFGLEPYNSYSLYTSLTADQFPALPYLPTANFWHQSTSCSIGWYRAYDPPVYSKVEYINPAEDANTIDFDFYNQYQYLLDRGKLAQFSLIKTNFYQNNTNKSIQVEFLDKRGKPKGPSYMKELPLSNYIDKTGYAYVKDFKFYNVENNVITPGTYVSPGGLILTNTNDDIAEFSFYSSKSNFVTFPNYQGVSINYLQNDLVEYINYNERKYYRNINGTDTFSENWQQISKTVFPENNVIFNLDINRLYEPGETLNVDGRLYGISQTVFGSDFPTNFFEINRKENLVSANNNFFLKTSENDDLTSSEINNFIINNSNDLPLAFRNINKSTYNCPKPCTNVSFLPYENNNYLSVINSNIDNTFYNYTYTNSYGLKDMISLGYTPTNKTGTNFLENNEVSFTNELYSQYLFDIPKPDIYKDCTGTCYTVDNIRFSNSLLSVYVPQDIDTQDLIKYSVENFSGNIHSFLTPTSNIASPVNRTYLPGISFSNQTYNNIGLSVSYKPSFVREHGDFRLPEALTEDGYLSVELTNGSEKIGISATFSDFGYIGISSIANIAHQGTKYSFGDLYYITNLTTNEVVEHGYVDPVSGGELQPYSFIQIQRPNDQAISGDNYEIKFVTTTGSGFEGRISYDNKYLLWGAKIGISNVNSGNYSGGKYVLNNGVSVSFNPQLTIDYTPQPGINYLQRSFGVSYSFSDSDIFYQDRNNNDINIKIYSLFGADYFANLAYDSSIRNFTNIGEELPAVIFKPLRNKFFSTNDDFVLYDGVSTSTITNSQNIFKFNKNDDGYYLKCNPYYYPINIQDNYSVTIGGVNNKSIFNPNSITGTDYSKLNIITSNSPSILLGKNSEGISMWKVSDINTLFLNDILSSNDLLFRQLRQNTMKEYFNTPLNCSLYFTAEKNYVDFQTGQFYDVTYANDNFIYKDENNDSITTPISTKNYSCKFDQSKMFEEPLIFSFSENNFGLSIKSEGNIEIEGSSDNLFINYFIENLSIEREDYINYFTDPGVSAKNISITYQTNIGDINGNKFFLYIQNSEGIVKGKMEFIDA